jgi:hypothetical protein
MLEVYTNLRKGTCRNMSDGGGYECLYTFPTYIELITIKTKHTGDKITLRTQLRHQLGTDELTLLFKHHGCTFHKASYCLSILDKKRNASLQHSHQHITWAAYFTNHYCHVRELLRLYHICILCFPVTGFYGCGVVVMYVRHVHYVGRYMHYHS